MRFRHARGGLVRDIRDLEIERLRGQLREARAREATIRAEERERFSQLSAASKRFAASMRSRMDEKQRQQRRLDAQYAISRVVEEAGDLVASGPGIFRALGSGLGWEAGVLWTVEGDVLRCAGIWHPTSPGSGFDEACEGLRLRRGEGLPGRVWQREEACWVEDLLEDEGFPHKEAAAGAGLRCALAFPIQDGGRLVGVFELLKKEIQPVDEDLLRVAYLAGHQIGQLVERRRAEDERDRALARETEAHHRIGAVLESINDAFFALDGAWRFTYVNHRAEEMWNRRRGDLLGKVVWEEFPSAVGTEAHGAILQAAQTGETVGYEAFSPMLDAWISGRAYPSSGGVSVYFQDVTERERLRHEAEAGRARLEAVLQQMPGGVFIADHSGQVFLANGGATSIYGREIRSIEECGEYSLSYPYCEPIPWEDYPLVRALAGETTSLEHCVRRADGALGVISSNAAPVLDAEGRVVAAVQAFQDVTEIREARRTIEDRERRYRTLTANIPGAVFRCVHPDGRPTMEFVSERIEEITGHPAAAFLPGGDRSYLDVIHPEDRGKNAREVWRALERGSTYNIEYRVLHADGGVRWVNERGSGVFSEDGRLLWIDGAIFDVTDRKEAEAERDLLLAREWVAKAEAAERERISRELHDRVAHSMAVAHQSLQLHEVLAGTDPRRAESKLDLAREMIKASLESTRNLSAELRRLDAEEGIEAELRHLLDVAVPPGIQAGIRVEGDEAGVPGHVRGQLFLVMREAVRNAVSHSGCGSLSVGLDITPERVVGSVEDDGRGFDAAGGDGGVGLRSMRERAALLDGALELDCEPGRGTRVEVSVPLAGRG